MPIFSSAALDDDADDLVQLHAILHGKGPAGRSVKRRDGQAADRGARSLVGPDGKPVPIARDRFGISPREPGPELPNAVPASQRSPLVMQISTRTHAGR